MGSRIVGFSVIITMRDVCIDCAPDERKAREAMGLDPDGDRIVLPVTEAYAADQGMTCAVCGVRLDMRRARA